MNKLGMLCVALMLTGCALQPRDKAVEERMDRLLAQSSSRVVQSVDVPYLGGVAVARMGQDALALGEPVALRRTGTLEQMCLSLGSVVSMQFRVEETPPVGTGKKEETASIVETKSKTFSVQYEGPLHGLLDQMASRSGTSWSYDPQGNAVIFSPYEVKTFSIYAALGGASYSNTITNRSKDITASSALGGSTGEGASESQTAQTNQTQFKSDPLADVVAAVKAVLSPAGSVAANPAAGTITVRDTVPVVRQVSVLVDDFNLRLSRQVALNVYVWSLEISSQKEAGISLIPSINAGSVSIAGVPLTLGEGGQLSATIVDGNKQGSKGILEALYASGKATLLTSGSGITMSNRPLPIQHVSKEVYLASVTKETNEYSQSSTITPGEITHGFAMTVLPQILDRRRLILQYNVSLSSLDGMEEFETDDLKVQMPKISTKSFEQRVAMRMGQTLVLAGFAQEKAQSNGSFGLLSASGGKQQSRSIIIITIEVESVGEPLMAAEPALWREAA